MIINNVLIYNKDTRYSIFQQNYNDKVEKVKRRKVKMANFVKINISPKLRYFVEKYLNYND